MLWIGEIGLLVFNRGAFRVPLRRRIKGGVAATEGDSMARARALLMAVGGSTMSWMTTWPEMRYCFMTDGRGYVGYERHAGVALALSDPVVPEGTIADAVAEFTRRAEQGGLTPCLFSVTDAAADAARTAGWRTVQIAEDTIIDLPRLAFKGKKWQDVRSALNKAKRESITFRMTTLAEEPFAILAQVRAISEQWVGEKGLPEMGFTLGGVDEALDPAVKVGLAIDTTGSIHGVTSWLPVYAAGGQVRGWTLDVMRRRDDGFRSVMEFMIASACLTFQQDGRGVRLPVRCTPGTQRAVRRGAGPHGPPAGQARRLARALLRLPLAARLQGQVRAPVRAHPSRLPRRGGPAPHRRGSHQGLPARRDPSPAARGRTLGPRRAGRRGCAVNGSDARHTDRIGSCRVVSRRLRCDQHDEGDAHLGRPARFNSWVLHHTMSPAAR